MKKFKKGLLVAAAVATMSLSSASTFADESPPPSATVEVSSNPGLRPFTNFLAIDNANLNKGGNSWSQQSGYDYASVFVANSSSQTLNVYLSYDVSGSKQHIGTYTVHPNSNVTIHITHASGHVFYSDYSTADGAGSGTVSVRESDGPL